MTTTWAHANVIIGTELRRIAVTLDGPDAGHAVSFATDHNGEVDAMKKIYFFTAATWEDAVATAEALA